MKILSLKIRNYRTLESLDLEFPSSYAAICGPNDSGKTNVVRAVRALMNEDGFAPYFGTSELSLKNDFPKWKERKSDSAITLEVEMALDRERDAGVYRFVTKQLALETPDDPLRVRLVLIQGQEEIVAVHIGDQKYERENAQEVLNKLRSSKAVLFHNSVETDPVPMYGGGRVAGYLREISGQHESLVAAMKKTVNKGLAKISKAQQTEFENLLGRLQEKYKVGLTMPSFDFGYMPFQITLGDTKYVVPLDDWGSGTKNRTMVLLTLFRARQIGDSEPSASKITPVIVVEEPESFLHPSAQAEFGRILQDMAAEFQVQVIVTTHSPYLLSMQEPCSNVLLKRKTVYKQPRETERVPITAENWMAPFGLALGLETEEFKPWRALFLTRSKALLLVEGETDKEYLELLRNPEHGTHRLLLDGTIEEYGGAGSLQNSILLRFVMNRYPKVFVTFDLDKEGAIEKNLRSLELEKGRDYAAIGLNVAGKRNIEGLLPERITAAVYGANASLVQAAEAGTAEERKSAANRLKKLKLEEFKRQAKPQSDDFALFYQLAKTINRALRA